MKTVGFRSDRMHSEALSGVPPHVGPGPSNHSPNETQQSCNGIVSVIAIEPQNVPVLEIQRISKCYDAANS